MAEKDDSFLSEHGVDEDNDWMRISTAGCKVRMEDEVLWIAVMRSGETLNEFDD